MHQRRFHGGHSLLCWLGGSPKGESEKQSIHMAEGMPAKFTQLVSGWVDSVKHTSGIEERFLYDPQNL